MVEAHTPEHLGQNPWRRFWERGGWWRALLLAAVYYGVYLLFGLLVGAVFPDGGAVRGEAGSPLDVVIATGLPVLLGCIALLVFAASLGWLRELFGPQPVRGRGWMWVAVAVVLAINVSALLSTDYGKSGLPFLFAWLLTGLFVGFAEEVLTRGFAVNLLRKAGHGEISVALISSAIFAALHLGNVFTSAQGIVVTLEQVVYTFFFGICMYLALRLTGNLIWPILIHASTDPTLFVHGAFPASGSIFGLVPAFSTYLVVLTGLILMIVFIVSERRRTKSGLTDATVA